MLFFGYNDNSFFNHSSSDVLRFRVVVARMDRTVPEMLCGALTMYVRDGFEVVGEW